MKKTFNVLFLITFVFAVTAAFALNPASKGALDAFRRYEPDFANTLRRLEELDRRIVNLNLESGSERYKEIFAEAEDSMERIQKRYDLMEDFYNGVSGDNPNDRPELLAGFSRLEDLYRSIRDFYSDKFVNRSSKKGESPKKPVEEPVKTEPEKIQEPQKTSQPDAATEGSAAASEQKLRKVEVSGTLKLEFKNRNEVTRPQTNTSSPNLLESAVPNGLNQSKLSLSYKFDEKRQLFVEDRFLTRRRVSPSDENYFTLSYLLKESDDRAWTFKNTLQHSWFKKDKDIVRNMRDNLFEIFFNDHWTKRERLASIGYQKREYPNNTRQDYHQFLLGDQETWFMNDGNIFAEVKGEWRRFDVIQNRDQDRFNVYGEYNRSYAGNKSELTISNTFDRLIYDQESPAFYVTSYYDNYFRLNYELPMHSKLAYSFEGQHTIRNYASDELRGYKEVNLFAAARIKIDDKTRTVYDYRFIHNDENTRNQAHKNHKLHSMWQKNFSDDFRARWDSNYHIRTADVTAGEDMEFKENLQNVKLTWRLKNQMNLVWNNEYLSRIYERLGFRDYRYLMSGLALSYAKAQKYDWKIDQSWRKFNFRNGAVATGWEGESQPITELQYNCTLSDDLKLRLRASWEKSYYRQFEAKSQELLWDFTRPMTISEFFGGLEYVF